jgi:predicted nucleic acid-binding protein
VVVIDASALVEIVLRPAARSKLAGRLLRAANAVHAPHLIDIEVANALRRLFLMGAMTSQRGVEALEDLAALRLIRHSHVHLLPRIWQLRHNVSAYDAAYLALAEELNAPLVTCDRRLSNSAGHRACVELF